MNSSIYLSNKEIQIVRYDPKGAGIGNVQDALCIPLPARTMLSGAITDAGQLTSIIAKNLHDYPEYFKNAELIIDTNALLVKKAAVPKLKPREYQRIAQEEFASSEDSHDDLVTDYSIVPGAGEQHMLAVAIDQPVLEAYLDVFEQAGVTLSAVRVGISLLVKLVKNTPAFAKGSVALTILDDVSLLALVFKDGNYMFSTRSRIMAETPAETAQSLLQNLTSLVQFDKQIRASYYMGVSAPALDIMRQTKPATIEAVIAPFELAKNPIQVNNAAAAPLHFALVGTCAKSDSINLIDSLNRALKPVGDAEKRRIKPWYVVAGGFALICIIMFIYTQVAILAVKGENKRLNDYINAPDIAAKSEEANNAELAIGQYNGYLSQMQLADEYIDSYPALTDAVFAKLFSGADSNVILKEMNFNAATRTIHVSYTCPTELDSSNFVNHLKTFQEFGSVDFIGYNSQTQDWYSFDVTITLADGKAGNAS